MILAVALSGAAAGGALAQDAATPAVPTPALRSGDVVRSVQRAVGVADDGIYGPVTRAAVRRFQRRGGLVVDGIAGPRTLAALGLSARNARPDERRTGTARARAAEIAPATTAALERIARCESGGDPTVVSADGRYRGKYQFDRATWRSLGGAGDPAAAPEPEQDARAAKLLARRGTAPWPICG